MADTAQHVRIILRGPAQLERALVILAHTPVDEHKPLAMILEPFEENHTRQQQKLYRACIGEAAKEIGYSPDELHEVLLRKHFGTKTIALCDVVFTMPNRRTTTNEDGERDPLKKKPMTAFYDWAMAFIATEFGVRV